MPLVTVIIPTYNHSQFVGQAINSVLEQTMDDLELIVVDDGSTDDTKNVVSAIDDPRIRYHHQENQGLASTRNTGLRLARGKYIGFLDADDYWLPGKLASQINLLEANTRLGLVYGGYYVVDENGTRIATRRPRIVHNDTLAELILDNYVTGSATTSVVRAEVFEQVGSFNQSLKACEDWDMWLRVAAVYSLGAVNDIVACIRVHGNNMTSNAALMDKYFQIVVDMFFQQHVCDEVARLRSSAKSRAKVRAAVFAGRGGTYRLSARFCLQALHYDPRNIDAYYLLMRSLLRQAI